jgi:hypothetical protein
MKRKMVSAMTLVLLLTSMLTVAFNIQPVKAEPRTWTVDDDGPADFHSVQEAIDTANSGDTILVASGTYTEWDDEVYVNKTISLIGENPNSTILERGMAIINADNVRISGFTLDPLTRADVATLHISCSNNVIFSSNLIRGNGNDAITNDRPNAFLYDSHNCTLKGNTWMPYECWDGGRAGLHFLSSTGNTIIANDFLGGGIIPWAIWDEGGNTFYHNNFWMPGQLSLGNDTWHNGYPSGGNYWSDYNVTDLLCGPNQNETGSDGIVDVPYVIDANSIDNYPLLNPWTSATTSYANVTKKGTTYPVELTTNATVSDFKETPGSIKLSLSGITGDSGYVRIIQPIGLNSSDIKVFINNTKLPFPSYNPPASISNNGTHYFIYFVIVFQSTYNVSVWFPATGDVNADGYVGIDDIFEVAIHFGSELGHPRYDIYCDLNEDNYIGIDDIFTAASHFGQEDP